MTEERRDAQWDKGLETRKAVVGETYVSRKISSIDGFDDALQDYVTRTAWGEVWTRPGLPRRERSILTLGMLMALGRSEELAIHLRGAVNNGLTADEIKECVLQSAVYCGAPAALEADRIARKVLTELGMLEPRE